MPVMAGAARGSSWVWYPWTMSTLPPQSNPTESDAVSTAHTETDAVVPSEPALDDLEETTQLSAAIIVALALALLLCVALVLIAYRGR